MPNYICWTKHGERGVIMEEDEEEDMAELINYTKLSKKITRLSR
jgi:hypothetical protein